jgi:hypothetical protein
MSDLDPVAQSLYGYGFDGIGVSAVVIQSEIDAYLAARDARRYDPAAYPSYPQDVTTSQLALAITGHLLDAGWLPPDNCTRAPHQPPA